MERILRRSPAQRQTLLFSATMPPAVEKFAQRVLRRDDLKRIDQVRGAAGVLRVPESLSHYCVPFHRAVDERSALAGPGARRAHVARTARINLLI